MTCKLAFYIITILFISQFALGQETDEADDRFIDFSYAGYDFGGKELPLQDKLPQFNVIDFGAIPNDQESDLESIRKAIDAAENAGGGIVLFPAGRFLINKEKGKREGLRVESSRIVLRGAGDGSGGTELFMKEHLVPDDPSKKWTTPPMMHFEGEHRETSIHARLTKSVNKGDMQLEFDRIPDLKPGDIILISAQGTFLNDRLLEGLKTREIWENINQKGVEVKELHQVERTEGRVVKLRAPLTVAMNKDEEWKIVKYNMIGNCGFENIHFSGNFMDKYVHHKDARHDSGFKALQMTRCHNSWIRNCTFTNVSAGAHFKLALTCTMLNCSTDGNPGHESFNIATSTRCLMAFCEDHAPQWHGPCASHASVGTVIYGFGGISPGIDLHGSCPRHTLFDRCVMAGLDGESVGKTSHGGSYLDLPNHLIGLVLWNFKQTGFPRAGFSFWDTLDDFPEQNYGPLTVVNPVIVGFHGIPMSFEKTSVGYLESMGLAVHPESLYVQQLGNRGLDLPLYLTR